MLVTPEERKETEEIDLDKARFSIDATKDEETDSNETKEDLAKIDESTEEAKVRNDPKKVDSKVILPPSNTGRQRCLPKKLVN